MARVGRVRIIYLRSSTTPTSDGQHVGSDDDGPAREVHSGFFAGSKAVSRRVKELLVSATAGTPGEWELLVTGHSLGGALATLMSTELVGAVDVSRGFKEKEDASLFVMAQRFLTSASQVVVQVVSSHTSTI